MVDLSNGYIQGSIYMRHVRMIYIVMSGDSNCWRSECNRHLSAPTALVSGSGAKSPVTENSRTVLLARFT